MYKEFDLNNFKVCFHMTDLTFCCFHFECTMKNEILWRTNIARHPHSAFWNIINSLHKRSKKISLLVLKSV